MGSPKQHNLLPFPIIPTQAVSGDVTSLVTDLYNKDNVSIQYVWTGTLSGSFSVQTSNDYVPNPNGGLSAVPLNAGNWSTVSIGSGAVALGSADNGTLDMNELSARYLRTIFTYTSGTGNLTATIVGKAI